VKTCKDGRKKKQKSQPSLESLSKQPTVVESTDTVQSDVTASSAAAAAAQDSNTTLVEPDVIAAETVAQHREPVIGLSLTTCQFCRECCIVY